MSARYFALKKDCWARGWPGLIGACGVVWACDLAVLVSPGGIFGPFETVGTRLRAEQHGGEQCGTERESERKAA